MTDICTYVHLRPDFSPFYVGKGSVKRAHNLHPSQRNKHHGNVVKKHGRGNILVEVMICQSECEAFLREKLVIAALRASGVDLANMTDGGEGTSGLVFSSEHRAKISASLIGKSKSPEAKANIASARIGRKLSPQHRANIGKAGIGRTLSAESRARISAANTGNTFCLGKAHSAASRAKMSHAMMGNKNALGTSCSPETRAKIGEKRRVDLVGMVFSRLTVLQLAKSSANGQARWLCRCVCGTEKEISGSKLRQGNTRSCGCYRREVSNMTNTKTAEWPDTPLAEPLVDDPFSVSGNPLFSKHEILRKSAALGMQPVVGKDGVLRVPTKDEWLAASTRAVEKRL